VRCCLTTRLARHSPGMLPTASAGWNRHQLAANVSVPAAIRGGDQVAEETPSELSDQLSVRTLPTSWQVGPRQSGPHESRNWRRPTPSGEPGPRRRDLHGRSAPGYTEEIWAENRATRGRHPSADPGAKTGEGGTMTPCLSLSGLVRNRKSTSLNPENSISR
jgi:hypothetical protein